VGIAAELTAQKITVLELGRVSFQDGSS